MHKHEQTRSFKCIEKLKKCITDFYTTSGIYIIIYISTFHNIISIYKHMSRTRENICIITIKKLQNLSPTSTKIHCKSLVNKYINQHEKLNHLCVAKFVTN
jgi:hypothetical protein